MIKKLFLTFLILLFSVNGYCALVENTNCGFVTTAPTADPSGTSLTNSDNTSRGGKFVAPADCTITEIGWWCNNVTEEANYEVGVYTHTSDVPLTLLSGTSRTNAKGTDAGWKTATVDIDVTGGTTYWLAYQLDTTSTRTETDKGSGFSRRVYSAYDTTLASTYSSDGASDEPIAIYALYVTTGRLTTVYVDTDNGTDDVYHGSGTGSDAYATLSYAESEQDRDIDTSNESIVFNCVGATADTTQVTFSSVDWTTSADNTITVNGNATGIWDDDNYHLAPTDLGSNDGAIAIELDYVTINHVQIFPNRSGYSSAGIRLSDGGAYVGIYIIGNIIKAHPSAGSGGDGIYSDYSDGYHYVYNNLIYGFPDNGITNGGGNGAYIELFNNTISNCGIGVEQIAGQVRITAKNNAVFNNTTDWNANAITYNVFDYNASDDDTGGANWVNISPSGTEVDDWNANFTSYSTGDFSVKDADADIYRAGTSGGSIPTTDIRGLDRNTTYTIGAFDVPNYTNDSNCQGAWLFTEGSGTSVADSSQNSNTGTFKASGEPAWGTTDVPDNVSGNAVEYDVTDDYINIGTLGDFGSEMDSSTTSFTAWIKTSTSNNIGVFGSFDNSEVSYFIRVNEAPSGTDNQAGKIRIRMEGSSTDILEGGVNSNTGLSDGDWHHLSVLITPLSNSIIIYVDGVIQTTAYQTQSFEGDETIDNFVQDLYLGALLVDGSTSTPLNGLLADSGLFNKALLPSSIHDIYAFGLTGIVEADEPTVDFIPIIIRR